MTILIVDDHEPNRYQLQVLLGANGYQVVSATNGVEALRLAREAPPDLVVSDILMPVMDGFALCREWKSDERLRSIPFIFYTATYTDERDRDFALSLGAERFVVKPEEPEDLLRIIRQAVEPAQRAPAAPALVPASKPLGDSAYLRQHNETLIRKLEDKMTQLEQINRALLESEERYRLLFESSIDAVLLTIPDGGILSANPAACLMFGRSEDELKRLGRDTVVDASDPRVALAIDERARTGRFRGELTFFRRDGSEFAGEISSSLFRTREGETRSSMVIRDVTERRKAEEALRQSEALLDQMGRVARIGAWQMDLLTRTARWTRGTYDIVEIEPGEPIPGPDEHVRYYLPEHRALVTEAMRALIEESKPLDFEAQLRTAKGTIKWCHANGRAVRDHGRCIMVHGTLQDITERKRADEAIQEQLAELRRWHQVRLGREGRVLGLKKEVNDLLARLGEPPRYVTVEDGV